MGFLSLTRYGLGVALLLNGPSEKAFAEVKTYAGVDRPAVAIELFEAHCLPYLKEARRIPAEDAPQFERVKFRVRPHMNEVRGTWRHLETDLQLYMAEDTDGTVVCTVSDVYVGFGQLHSFRFKNLVGTWVSTRFPGVEDKEGWNSKELTGGLRYDIFVRGWELGITEFEHRTLLTFVADETFGADGEFQKRSSTLSFKSVPCEGSWED